MGFLSFLTAIVLAQNTYFGPIQPLPPGSPHRIRVEILIYDDPAPGGVEIDSVEFNGQAIPLKPRDIHAFRGEASFQLPAGNYPLKWKVRRDRWVWPRTLAYKQQVHIDARDLWLQIVIQGHRVEIH